MERVFAAKLKELRVQNNMTQKEIAEIVHKGESTVRMWELGKSEPDHETLLLLCKTFHVNVDYFFNSKNEVPTEFVIMARKTGDMPEPDKQKLFKIFDDTIDLFLKNYEAANEEGNKKK